MPWKRLFQVCTVTQPLLHHEEPKLTEYVFRVFFDLSNRYGCCDYIVADLTRNEDTRLALDNWTRRQDNKEQSSVVKQEDTDNK